MGYYANGGGSLNIKKESYEDMKKAVQDWIRTGQGGYTHDDPTWKPDADILRFFDYFGFEAEQDDDGNIIGVWFPENKISNTGEFLEVIAPHVEDRSFLDFTGEDGDHWRWSFKGHELYETQGILTYPGDPYEEE